ncbi:flagellar biosynthetic protein FliP [Pseudomethylobacillus aquaticus]|uniref:Flagellar biosynthetic protein FliP n=2 Tax=Pseudomethylobacillus aquaticus TaxID=2676064 RepID=A0A3N0UZG7_9PROT|nr:flagellar biosynthetic protein FliP [Pseudomethylobacillus aquaticus]
MTSSSLTRTIQLLLLSALLVCSSIAIAAPADANALAGLTDLNVLSNSKSSDLASAIRILVLLTALSLIPTLLIATTSFLRIIVVLSMLRHGIGMQDTPPNAALLSIALFLTLFSMQPVWKEVNQQAWLPFQQNKVTLGVAIEQGVKPMRDFMVRQTRESDLALMVELSGDEKPTTVDDISITQLIPAFMLSELRSAFQIGFMVFLPFLLVDLIVASVLTSLGMMMVPPITISLPLKVLMFILIDGWNLVVKSLMGSFS